MMGAGVGDYGHIGVMATREMSAEVVTNEGYRSKFSHQNETAYPGNHIKFLVLVLFYRWTSSMLIGI